MPDDTFRATWRRHYGDCPPVGFLLRESYPDRWFRIHSLPASKRYPESAAELSILLARHNALAADILGEDAPCVVVTNPEYNGATTTRPRGARQLAALGLQPLMTIAADKPIEGGTPWWISLEAARLAWRSRSLDDLLTDVANHLLAPFVIMAESSGRVYAPYDGGADLFLESPADRDQLKEKYAAWLSPDPSGL